jgi:hypothetical protein
MKLLAYYLALFSFLLILLCACEENKITDPQNIDEVVVKVSNTDYNLNSFRAHFPDSASLHNISTAYSNNYSEERKAGLISNMKSKVTALRQDVTIIEQILTKTGCNMPGKYILPTYAEKAKYEGKDAWLIQFTYGLGNPRFGHYMCFVFSIPNLDTLKYITCR